MQRTLSVRVIESFGRLHADTGYVAPVVGARLSGMVQKGVRYRCAKHPTHLRSVPGRSGNGTCPLFEPVAGRRRGGEFPRNQRLDDTVEVPIESIGAAALRAVRCRRVDGAAQLPNHLVQTDASNQRHHVIVQTILFADPENRHDVGVVQTGRRLCLALESSQVRVEHQGVLRQHFHRDPAPQRLLLGLQYDAHAPTADLSDNPEIAQPIGQLGR